MAERLLPRSPTVGQETAYEEWMQRFGYNDARCDHCESLLDLRSPQLSNSGRYCSDMCYHLEENKIELENGDISRADEVV